MRPLVIEHILVPSALLKGRRILEMLLFQRLEAFGLGAVQAG